MEGEELDTTNINKQPAQFGCFVNDRRLFESLISNFLLKNAENRLFIVVLSQYTDIFTSFISIMSYF